MDTNSRRSRDLQDLTSRRASSTLTQFAKPALVLGLCAAALIALAPQAAIAQGRLDAQYEATLAGIPVGKGAWAIEIGDDTFTAAAQGGTAGLLKAFSGGTGSGASQGRVVNGALVPNAYTATTTTQKKSETIRLVLANGGVKDFSIDPAPPVDPDRVVVTDAHRKNVLDPMTGSMLRVPGNAEVLSPDSCRTGTGIFDGRMPVHHEPGETRSGRDRRRWRRAQECRQEQRQRGVDH